MKKDNITFQDFIKVDIRAGEVTNASLVEGSSKLIELMGKESQGMILALDKDGAPLLVEVPVDYEAGLPAM